jgi:putative SOS response-associated peptidase YedK
VCGRFVQTTSAERLALIFAASDTTAGALGPRYNVAPSTPVAAVLRTDGRRLGRLRWGFVPSWAPTDGQGPRPINVRAEGAATSRLFAPALRQRRCIVPLDGWYEWTHEAGARQPWFIRPVSGGPTPVAALWSTWRAPGSDPSLPPLGTVALFTTAASGAAAAIHHRMPLEVPGSHLEEWLDPQAPDGEALVAMFASARPDLVVSRVSRRVNDVRNDDAGLIDPVVD